MKYNVLRRHDGDKPYGEGDIREADPNDVRHLVGTVLEPIKVKAEPPVQNKAVSAPKNKGSK
jgi:hypothetical protein